MKKLLLLLIPLTVIFLSGCGTPMGNGHKACADVCTYVDLSSDGVHEILQFHKRCYDVCMGYIDCGSYSYENE